MWQTDREQRTDRETNYRGHSNPNRVPGWAGQYTVKQTQTIETKDLLTPSTGEGCGHIIFAIFQPKLPNICHILTPNYTSAEEKRKNKIELLKILNMFIFFLACNLIKTRT